MGDRLPVNVGVKSTGNKFVITYKVGKNVEKKDITWEWMPDGDKYVAKLEARSKTGDIKFHNSAPIDGETYKKLGKPKMEKDGDYYRVELKKESSDVTDISEYFDVQQ